MDLTGKEARIKRSVEHIEDMTRQIEEQVRRKLLEPGVATRTRRAVEEGYKRYVLHQILRIRGRLSREQQRWMRVLLADRLIENPNLHRNLKAVVEQLRRNYGFEWVTCPFTITAQREARNIILAAAESEFGDTPAAGPLAFVRCHHRKYKIQDITNYDEAYLQAVALEKDGFFVDRGSALRKKLGVRAPVAATLAAQPGSSVLAPGHPPG